MAAPEPIAADIALEPNVGFRGTADIARSGHQASAGAKTSKLYNGLSGLALLPLPSPSSAKASAMQSSLWISVSSADRDRTREPRMSQKAMQPLWLLALM
jgi:hypothetical protein